jgi:hypothetical protein
MNQLSEILDEKGHDVLRIEADASGRAPTLGLRASLKQHLLRPQGEPASQQPSRTKAPSAPSRDAPNEGSETRPAGWVQSDRRRSGLDASLAGREFGRTGIRAQTTAAVRNRQQPST